MHLALFGQHKLHNCWHFVKQQHRKRSATRVIVMKRQLDHAFTGLRETERAPVSPNQPLAELAGQPEPIAVRSSGARQQPQPSHQHQGTTTDRSSQAVRSRRQQRRVDLGASGHGGGRRTEPAGRRALFSGQRLRNGYENLAAAGRAGMAAPAVESHPKLRRVPRRFRVRPVPLVPNLPTASQGSMHPSSQIPVATPPRSSPRSAAPPENRHHGRASRTARRGS